MQRDKKVGLALAILLCSIVGAFFIRDEGPRGNAPELKDPKQLDAKIAQGDKSPYSEPDSRRPNNASRNDRSNNARPWELPDFLEKDSKNSTTSKGKVNSSKDPSDRSLWGSGSSDITSLTPPTDDESSAVPIPRGNEEWTIPGKNDSTIPRNNSNGSPKSQTHVVAAGETLSSISGKYLGTQARYLDIFQANRDQLKSPDDLKVGMKLNIPDRNGEPKSNALSRSNTVDRPAPNSSNKPRTPSALPNAKVTEKPKSNENSSDTPPKKVQFKPAKTGPTIRRSAELDDAGNGKSLTQIAPLDLREVDDEILADLERETQAEVVAEKPSADSSAPRVAQAERDSIPTSAPVAEPPMPVGEESAE